MKFLSVVLVVFLIGNSYSQWNHHTLFTQHLNINCIAKDPTNTFCVAGAFNLFKNTGNPTSWTQITNNTNSYFSHNSVIVYDNNHILSVGRLYNPSNGGIMYTYDGGANWTTVDLGVIGFELTDVARNGSTLVAVGTWGKIYRSTNDGVSWANIPSGTTTDLHTVCYNPALNQWTIGGLNKKLTSFDNGLTYTSATVTGEIFDINYENGFLIETTNMGSMGALGYHCKIDKKTGTGTTLNSYIVPFAVTTTDFLPDGNLITAGTKFAVLSASSNNILVSKDSIHNLSDVSPETVNEMVFLNSVGYAVGPDGALGYRSLPFTSNYYVPATFQLSQSTGCEGEPFTAIAINSNSDSYKWYYDSTLIGTDDTLNYAFSSIPGSHTISLVTSYQGIRDSITKSSFTNYNTFLTPLFNFNLPASVCYGTDASGYFHNTTPFTVDTITIRTTTTVLHNLITQVQQNDVYYISLPNLTAADTVFIEYKQHNACDTQVAVFTYPVAVQAQMANAFSVITSQPTYCFPTDSIQFQLTTSEPGITYSIKNNNYIPGSAFPTTTTISPSTVSTVGTSTFQLPNNTVFYPDYGAEVYNYSYGINFQYTHPEYINKIAVEVAYNGCPSQTYELVSFTVQNPHAMFHTSFGTQINDTVEIVNDQINAAQTWSSTIGNGFSSQLTATAPILGSYQSGEEEITLINQSSYGCADTITQTHTFLDPVASNTSIVHCLDDEFKRMIVVGSLVDKDDNLYEYGYEEIVFGIYSTAVVRKISSNGTLLWQKVYPYTTSNAINRFTAGAMDSLGNGYFARVTDVFAGIYVFDSNGNPVGSPPTINNVAVDEIIIDNSKLIYSTRLGVYVYNITYSPNPGFSFVQSFQAILPDAPGNRSFLKQTGPDSFAYMANVTTNNMPTMIGTVTMPTNATGTYLFGANLSLSSGFSNQTQLAYTSLSSVSLIHDFAVDTANNRYFLLNEFWYQYHEYQILSTPITLGSNPFNSFLVKTDDQFNLLSLTETNLRKGKIAYWKNNQFLLSGISHDGLKLKRPNNYQSLRNSVSSGKSGLGIAVVNTDCSLVNGINFGLRFDNLNPTVNANNNTIYVSNRNFDWNIPDTIVLPFNGEVISYDSCFVLKLSTNHCLTSQDIFGICSSDSIFYLNYVSQEDSLAYTMHTNGISNMGYFPIEDNFIVVTAPNPNNGFTLELFDPQYQLLDSFNYVVYQTYYPDIDSLFLLECQPGTNLYFSDPNITNYEWNFNGVTAVNQSLYVATASLTVNDTVTGYLTTRDSQGCFATQEFEVIKLTEEPFVPNFPASMDLLCGYPLQLYADSNQFQNITWNLLGTDYTSNPLFVPANTITTNGMFNVYISGEDMQGCPFTDQILVDACSDLSLSENVLEISIYPNPANDYFVVDLANNYAEIDLQLCDLNGKVLLVQHAENTHSVNVSTESLARGYYILTGKLSSGVSITPISILKD
ncbi:T9SS type A sorting domain-containing protein [Fluviicola chungangensis]|uniref:T9SS type A sorting domain-containing protein n=1 Tax=Fluviicola chungangensis TaxID=2597671 RepID=A0A556N355_9FLAO|nr:T9SS type A sorting domain-containing protein [Fluviicola chungangensis]TSJ46624.1 T9SS type A sorting domain-containing protein [Fluviicola chungangensis]